MPYRPNQFQLTVIKPYYKDNSFKPLQDIPEDVLEENYNQHALEGDYNSNIIVIDIPQL